jgi:hypothetical protein
MQCLQITRGRRAARSSPTRDRVKKKKLAEVSCFGVAWKQESEKPIESEAVVEHAEDPEEIQDAVPQHDSSETSSGTSSETSSGTSSEDRELMALADSIKQMYARHVNDFVKEGKKHGVRKKNKSLHVHHALWDEFYGKKRGGSRLREFLALCKKHGASPEDPKVLLGYHGTSSSNAAKILQEGFKKECRRSHGDGAYFSGVVEYAAKYAKDHHLLRGRNSARDATGAPEGPGDILLVALLLDGHKTTWVLDKKTPDVPVINATWSVFDEQYAMPLARLRGF